MWAIVGTLAFIPSEIEAPLERFSAVVRDKILIEIDSRENGRKGIGNSKNGYFQRVLLKRGRKWNEESRVFLCFCFVLMGNNGSYPIERGMRAGGKLLKCG